MTPFAIVTAWGTLAPSDDTVATMAAFIVVSSTTVGATTTREPTPCGGVCCTNTTFVPLGYVSGSMAAFVGGIAATIHEQAPIGIPSP